MDRAAHGEPLDPARDRVRVRLIGQNIATSLEASRARSGRVLAEGGLANYVELLTWERYQHALWNLLILTIVFVAGTMFFGLIWALLLEKGVPGEGLFRSLYLFPMAVSFIASGVVWRWLLDPGMEQEHREDDVGAGYQAVMIPLQRLMIDLNTTVPFLSGIPTLIIAHVIYGIPICTLIFRNYYATAVPSEILEAARVDGASMWRIYHSIVLPVSAPAFVVTLIWQFTSAWNDFLFALFLTNRNTGPVTYALMELASAQNPDYARTMAGVLIASLPTLLVYIVLGKYFISGLMSGSVK